MAAKIQKDYRKMQVTTEMFGSLSCAFAFTGTSNKRLGFSPRHLKVCEYISCSIRANAIYIAIFSTSQPDVSRAVDPTPLKMLGHLLFQ
ncbi:uncharacterized protein PHALS_03740 [Plasmopara halstedii]|uniref:Uncharacterized protein n=1 Tax=Plasmopara halstedii TaxID=4781 RepID=A0A0N7L7H4_PLAHL|nr:uncharacterized protein PHALS_03740 [Plasmopara halstedii]CEG47083.1 hypothetical protein PHALS_03740 [Plasmopara halstedii]|eukprot:XP_024583452.1 hypothetical protein PHALS_03740 [Plasmopara halstedii]